MKEVINKSINETKNTTINKTGITLIMLVITIAVLIILASAAIVGVGTLVTSGKKTAFATDLKSIEDAVEVYYNDNGVLPIKDDTTPYVLTTLTALSGDGAIELGKEITENEDTAAQFYEVDLDKINSSGGTKGKKSNGEGNDIFVVSSNNIKVYYVKGEKIGSDMYFSLTSKLTSGTNFKKDTTDTSTITTVEAQGMKLTKDKKDWTNDLNITLETTVETGETIKYIIAGVVQEVELTFDQKIAIIPLNSTTITGDTLTAFNSATTENKTIVVQKVKVIDTVETVIATITMNISNLDLQIGTVPVPTIKSYDNNNVLDFNAATDLGGSNIREIRYEYITKWNSVGTVENYFTIPQSMDENYMLNSSKKQVGLSISIPKNIKTIAVCVVDKAGNISRYSDTVMYTTITIPDINLKVESKSYPTNGTTLTKAIIKPTTNIINAAAGTVEAWVEVNSALRADVADKTIFSTYADEKYKNTIVLRHNRDNMWQAIISSDVSQVSDISVADTLGDGMHLFTIKWSPTEFTLFIDGVKTTATTTTPKLMQSVPANFYIGSGPRLNLVRNGYINQGSNTNFSGMTYTTEDYYSFPACIKSPNTLFLAANDYIAVDANKTYYQSGWYRQLKVGSASVNYCGFYLYDAYKSEISSYMVSHYTNTETELAQDLKTGDTVVYLKNATNWKTSSETMADRKLFVIYNYKDYIPYTYSKNWYYFTTSSTTDNSVTLTSAYTGGLVKAGTKVANGSNGIGSFIYTSMGNSVIPNTWKQFSGYISGNAINQPSSNQFRYGTRYVKPLFLINWNAQTGENLLIDDIELIDMTNTIFNTKIQEVCISNIARTDSDILKRYKAGALTRDSSVTYMLSEK